MKIAIVTGASSGIGREFAVQLARKKDELEELWAIARSREKLEELKEALPIPVRVLPLDLSRQEDLCRLEELLDREKPQIQVLVNASGFGKFGNFCDLSQEEIIGMLDLDGKSLVLITHMALPYCVRGSRILQIGSASAFQPIAGFGVYGAVKSFVVAFSRSLHRELRDRGITVTAVCPYWVKTNFISTAQETENPGTVTRFPFAANAEQVVRKALRDSEHGRDMSTYQVSTVMRLTSKLPHRWLMAVWDRIRS